MKVIICGAGQVGYGIAEQLSREDNEVSVIDTAAPLITAITETLDVRGYVGHGAHPDMLAKAGADQADMIIAVTLHDEINIVACEVAHALFSVPTKIARIRDQSYLKPEYADLFSRENMSIDVTISPEVEVGKMVLRRIAFPGATDVVRFADDTIYIKTDEALRAELAAEGCGPFVWAPQSGPRKGEKVDLGYWRLPDSAMDDLDEAARWGAKALAVAKAKAAGKRKPKRKP